VKGRGVCCDRWSIYGAKKSPDRAGDRETRAVGLLPSRPRLGNDAKFALSFAKLLKMQTPNAKPLDTSFCDFWQTTRMQTSNAKLLSISRSLVKQLTLLAQPFGLTAAGMY